MEKPIYTINLDRLEMLLKGNIQLLDSLQQSGANSDSCTISEVVYLSKNNKLKHPSFFNQYNISINGELFGHLYYNYNGKYRYTAYSDIKNLKPENVVKGEDGRLWIHTRRKKTDMISHVPLLPIALQIVEKYKNNPYCMVNDILLPVYTNQKLNAYLKEIADICGITKHISTHTARHTFATTVTLNNDVPIESVSKMLGHSTIKMTQHYAKLSDKKVGIDMEKIQSKFTTEKVSLHFPPICQN